ncbi:MAK10-like protein [Tanacetum coccineum]|uniref:MAK10-like protein n=1 Tax=Tanacetum coccineum TaxID=301880 RepID=A0ABQ4Y1N0_9ASTR
MGDANPIRTFEDYFKPSHEGYKNTIELPVGNNVVPLRSDTIRERMRLCLFQFSLRDQASNWLEHLPAGSITTWADLTTRFLAQFFPPGRTAKLRNDILLFQQHQGESLSEAWTQDLALYDNESWNDPKDFAKPVKAISLPQDVPSTSDRCLIKLENQVQRLIEAHLALTQPLQVTKITSSCEICSGPYDTQYCMENPKQAFVEYASSRIDKAGGLVSNFMASQEARLFKFEADFKQQQSEMTNKIDTVLKAITYRMAGALPSDTVKNPKLNVNSTTSVFSARSYPTEDPQCSTKIYGSINTIAIHQSNPHNDKPEEDHENSNAVERKKEQIGTPQLELKDLTAIEKLGPIRNDKEREIEWLDVEEPLDLVDKSKESFYESLIKEMHKCSLNYDFRIKKGDPRNLKIPYMIDHKFTANAYIDIDLPMNIMSLAYRH